MFGLISQSCNQTFYIDEAKVEGGGVGWGLWAHAPSENFEI